LGKRGRGIGHRISRELGSGFRPTLTPYCSVRLG
jgi:hypothetical protein